MYSLFAFYISALALLAPMLACVGVGAYWGKRALPFSANFLALLVTSVSTPALVFHTLVTTELDNAVLLELGGATLLILLVCGLASAAALWLLRLPVRALLQTTMFPNAGNLGLPLAYLAFGDAGFSGAIVFFAVRAFVQNTIGVRLLPNAGVKGAWKSPVMIASVLAVVLRGFNSGLPQWVLDSAELLGSLTVPLMLISLGYALAFIPASGLRAGSVVAALRLVLGAASAWAVSSVMGLSASMQGLFILQMTMPCAVMSYMYATRYTDKGEVSAGAVLVSTVAFLALSPLIMALVGAPIPGLQR